MGSRLEKNSTDVRKRIESHTFEDEHGEEYSGSTFGGFTDYMRRKKIKLQNLDSAIRSQSADKPAVFRGVVVHVNGYTQPSLSDLHTLIVSYGGGFMQYLDGKTTVTHVVASNLTPKKKVEFAKYRIVKPAWVVDSVNARRLLPWESYRLVDEGVTQKILGFDGGKIVSQLNTQRPTYRDQTDTSWYTSHVNGIVTNGAGEDDLMPTPRDNVAREATKTHKFDPPEGRQRPETPEEFGPTKDLLQISAATPGRPPVVERAPMSAPRLARTDGIGGTEHEVEDQQNRTSLSPFATDAVSAESPDVLTAAKRQLTAEEHNAILLQNPHMAKSSTANPDFINQYYRESRLHHLSSWKAELKAQLQARAAERSSQKTPPKRAPGSRRYIMHIDFDSFFAAVSLRKHPQLKDQPVVIAHGSGPGSEIASCNYVARKYGVRNGMWMKTALQQCPNIKVLPYDYKEYEQASSHFYDSILDIDGVVQSISIDEALLDVSQQCIQAGGSDGKAIQEGSIYREQSKANELATKLRALVQEKTDCHVSVGIGNSILLAKVALRKAKPAGQFLIKPDDALDILGELTVTDLPGVAWSIGNKLEEIGIKLVKDIRAATKERLINALGPKTGEKLWEYSRGIDRTEVGEQVVRKSVSAEINWGIRFVTQQQAEEFVQSLCDELHRRLLENAVKGRQLTVKIMRKAADAGMDPPKNLGHGKCDTFNKSLVLGMATHDKEIIGKEAVSILRGYGFPPGELRGLGVQMQKLEPLKPASSSLPTNINGSQRRLQFKHPERENSPVRVAAHSSHTQRTPRQPKLKDAIDPIEDTVSPEKPTLQSSIVGALTDQTMGEDSNRRPLNIGGTQFVLPTQIDPSVLAELPADIRSKIAQRQGKPTEKLKVATNASKSVDSKSRSASPFTGDPDGFLPSHSQLDPEILDALPADVREEVLAQYKHHQGSASAASRGQALLPQSPRKAKVIPASKKLVLTPTKKNKISSFLGKPKQKTSTAMSTLTQSNFVSLAKNAPAKGDEFGNLDNLSESFLEELPEDIRLELQGEQKRQRLRTKSGLSLGAGRKKKHAGIEAEAMGHSKLTLGPRSEKPTFTSRKLSTLPELRIAISAWLEEFSGPADEGPFDEDVAALADYLHKVVTVENNMAKAVDLVNWVGLILERQSFDIASVKETWQLAVKLMQDEVQAAVAERSLPPVDFN